MYKQIEQVDVDTGEVMRGCMMYIPHRPKMNGIRWFMAFQDSFEEIAKDEDLTGETFRVLFYLYSKLDFENFIQQTQTEIAEELRMQKTHISRAIKVLTSKQIILEGPKVGRSRCYRLNPNYGWKGRVKNFENYKKEKTRKALEVIDGGLPSKTNLDKK